MRIGPVDLLDADGLRGPVEVEVAGGRIARIARAAAGGPRPLLCPALVDLQVNGGGGLMLADARTPEDLARIADAHRRLGTGHILPTLISDRPETAARIVDLAARAGGLGLHLEGPHLARPGAHDPARLRDLTDADVAAYLDAAHRLPHLMVTLAPERASAGRIAALARAGVIVALGHSDCTYEEAAAAFDAGARMVTHLFNAMSGLGHRAPGLAGAALDRAGAFGLIADGHHVHDAALRIALAAGGDRAVPVSDAMALTGTGATRFALGGREITREGIRLTLADGTLAGAHAPLLDGLRRLAAVTGRPLAEILPMGFDRPWRVLGRGPRRLAEGDPADLLRLEDDRVEALVDGAWVPA